MQFKTLVKFHICTIFNRVNGVHLAKDILRVIHSRKA